MLCDVAGIAKRGIETIRCIHVACRIVWGVPEPLFHILIRELDAMLKDGYHKRLLPSP